MLALAEYGYGRRYARAEKQVGRQADDGFEQVFVHHVPAYLPFACSAEQHSVGNDHANLAAAFLSHLYHVRDERPVALALRGYAAPKAVVRVVGRFFRAPLVQRERRIGDNGVKLHQPVVLLQLGVAQGVAPAYHGVVEAVQKHVHHSQRPRAAIHFLPVKREVAVAHFLSGLDEQRA